MKVKDTLELDPSEDIDYVVDVDRQETNQIIKEISEYIVTESLAKYFLKFLSIYNQGAQNTGVWVSGFYGSGKSYFAKILGYLLEDHKLKGETAKKRFIGRLHDISNAALIKNELHRLDTITNKVTLLNLGKMTSRAGKFGMARIFYEKFLESIGFSNTLPIGQLEMELFQRGEYKNFKKKVLDQQGISWEKIRVERTSTLRNVMGQALEDLFPKEYPKGSFTHVFEDVLTQYKLMDASTLAKQLYRYLSGKESNYRIVLIVDEIGQFVRGGKQSGRKLLELQGIAESMKEIGDGKLWLIATAQEKLKHIIGETGARKTDFAKISDRFQTKIHLTPEGVQKVLDERIFKKNRQGEEALNNLYEQKAGNISDLANPESSRSLRVARSAEDFSKDYPLLPYQRSILPNVLFSTSEKGQAGGTERGMIHVTYNLIKNIANEPIERLASIPELFEICGEAAGGDSALWQRFKHADDTFEPYGEIKPSDVLKTIFFLNKTKGIKTNLDNINRGLIKNVQTSIEDVKKYVEKHLDDLTEGKELVAGEEYSLAGEAYMKLLDNLEQEYSTTAKINKRLREEIEKLDFLDRVKRIKLEGNNTYSINQIYGKQNITRKRDGVQLVLLKPDFESEDSREREIEKLEAKSNLKEEEFTVYLLPTAIPEWDRKVGEILNKEKTRDKFQGDRDPEMRNALQEWEKNIKNNLLPSFRKKLQDAYQNGTIVVKGKVIKLEEPNFIQSLRDELKRRTKNLYSDRIKGKTPTEKQAVKLLRASPEDRYALPIPDQFQLFDSEGQFDGAEAKMPSIILKSCQGGITGDELETKFKKPPYGWNLEVVKFVIASLFVADEIQIKTQNKVLHSHQASQAIRIFRKTRPFRNAKFKSISEGKVSPAEKAKAVDLYNKLFADGTTLEHHIDQFQLAEKIREKLSEYTKIAQESKREFEAQEISTEKIEMYNHVFEDVNKRSKKEREFIVGFTEGDKISNAVKYLNQVNDFRINTLRKLSGYKSFVSSVKNDLSKNPELFKAPDSLQDSIDNFRAAFTENPVSKVSILEEARQKTWDRYHDAIKPLHQQRTQAYKRILKRAKEVQEETISEDVKNSNDLLPEVKSLITKIEKKICDNLKVGEQVAQCSNCASSLSEIKADLDASNATKIQLNQLREEIQYRTTVESTTIAITLQQEMNAEDFLQRIKGTEVDIKEAKKKAKEVKLKIELEE